MATVHAPGAGFGGGDLGTRGRRAAVIAAVVLAFVAIVVPFAVHALHDRGAAASTATPRTTTQSTAPATHTRHQVTSTDTSTDTALGSRGDLPALLPDGSPGLRDGVAVRLGDITTGTLRQTPAGGWQVIVRWDGRLQPVTTRGSVALGTASWVSRAGLLYSRVTTGTPGRLHVYAWEPQGGTAYTPPTLVATSLGDVCFNQAFTAFGGCPRG